MSNHTGNCWQYHFSSDGDNILYWILLQRHVGIKFATLRTAIVDVNRSAVLTVCIPKNILPLLNKDIRENLRLFSPPKPPLLFKNLIIVANFSWKVIYSIKIFVFTYNIRIEYFFLFFLSLKISVYIYICKCVIKIYVTRNIYLIMSTYIHIWSLSLSPYM